MGILHIDHIGIPGVIVNPGQNLKPVMDIRGLLKRFNSNWFITGVY
jgi:hypothetical protein